MKANDFVFVLNESLDEIQFFRVTIPVSTFKTGVLEIFTDLI